MDKHARATNTPDETSGGAGGASALRRTARVLGLTVAFALVACPGALAAKSSLTLHGPHRNEFGTPFQYTASGVARGRANYVYGWEAPFSPSCASSYESESKRSSLSLFTSRSVAKNRAFSIVVHFFARNTTQHRFCAYVVDKATGKTFAHAEASWSNYAAGATPTSPGAGAIQPTPVGEGQCQAKRFPDESAYAQIAVSGVSCETAEAVGFGADGAHGGDYSRAGFSCTGTAEGPGSTWAAAWTGAYYVYSCSGGGGQIAFNWGTDYAYVPASTLPTINPSG